MNKLLRIGVFLFFGACLFQLSCASFQAEDSNTKSGLAALRANDNKAAETAFAKGCKNKEVGSCLRVNPTEVSFTSGQLSILQGFTNTTSTQINVLFQHDDMTLQAVLWDKKNKLPIWPKTTQIHQRDFSDFATQQFIFEQLRPQRQYQLEIYDEKGRLIDLRELSTLSSKPSNTKVAIVSCANDSFKNELAAMWNQLHQESPDLLLMIGDNFYANAINTSVQTEQNIWRRYSEGRQLFPIYRQKQLIPTLATWDDHDYGADNGDSTFHLKAQATKIFTAFFAQKANGKDLQQGPGVATIAESLGLQIVLLDNRSYRTPRNLKTGPQEHFGRAQEEWMFLKLKQAKNPALIISGDQFFGGYHKFESYEGVHPTSFLSFNKKLKSINKPFVLISGDRHLTEIMKISYRDVGQNTFELTSSPIHAKTYPAAWDTMPNKRQLIGAANTHNYMLLNIQNYFPLRFIATAKGPQNKTLFSEKLQVAK